MKGASALKKRKKENDISFLGKIIYFFRGMWDKIKAMRLPERLVDHEKKLAGYNDQNSPDEAKLSYGLSMAKLVSAFLFCVLLLSVLLFGGNIFSYENVYYMFKDICYITSYSENRPETLNYSEPMSNQDFTVFKNGLAVASDSELKFFTSTGRVTMALGSEYTNPKIVCSDRSALVYDQGRRSFSIYNSFIQIYSETLDYPISTAYMAKDGSFAIVTKSNSYTSLVRIYSADLQFKTEYSKNDYVLSAELSSNGKYAAIMSFDVSDGESIANLNVLKKSNNGRYSSHSSVSVKGVMPYKCSFISDDRLALFCSDRVLIYDLKGNNKNDFIYPSSLSHLSIDDSGFAMIFKGENISGNNTVAVFDNNGHVTYSDNIKGNISDIAYKNGYLYLLCDSEAVRIACQYGRDIRINFLAENAEILTFDSGEVMICTPAVAYYVNFD